MFNWKAIMCFNYCSESTNETDKGEFSGISVFYICINMLIFWSSGHTSNSRYGSINATVLLISFHNYEEIGYLNFWKQVNHSDSFF
jgi:hypothetical protein